MHSPRRSLSCEVGASAHKLSLRGIERLRERRLSSRQPVCVCVSRRWENRPCVFGAGGASEKAGVKPARRRKQWT